MREVKLHPAGQFGRHFIPEQYLPAGKDEYYLRNQQSPKPAGYWRHLRSDEIETLVKNAVTCDDWDNIFVADPFHPQLIKNCEFFGLVRIGRLENVVLEHHELQVPAGITNSRSSPATSATTCAIHNVRYLAHYIIGDHVHAAEHRRDAHHQPRQVRQRHRQGRRSRRTCAIWLDLMNEAGGRAVLPFDGMIAGRRLPLGQVPRRRRAAGAARRDHAAAVRLPPRLLRHGRRRLRDQELPDHQGRQDRPALLHQGRQQAQEPDHQLQRRRAHADRRGRRDWSTASSASAATSSTAARPCAS